MTTPPFGYAVQALAADSETFVSIPFERPAAFVGHVASVAGNVVTVQGSPAWTDNQFGPGAAGAAGACYLFVRSGAMEGHSFRVTTNGTATISVDLEGRSLAGVLGGDGIRVVPYWTLGALFPPGAAGLTFSATQDPASPATTILLTDPAASGINPAPNLYFFHSGAWRQVGQSLTTSFDHVLLRPGQPLRVRNGANGGVLVMSGAVLMEKQAFPLKSLAAAEHDNEIALMRPVPVSLAESGLTAGGAFSASADALSRSDILMVFDNTEARPNKAAAELFVFFNSGWRKLGQPLTQDFGSEPVFGPGKGVVIRKAPNATGAPQAWVNAPKY